MSLSNSMTTYLFLTIKSFSYFSFSEEIISLTNGDSFYGCFYWFGAWFYLTWTNIPNGFCSHFFSQSYENMSSFNMLGSIFIPGFWAYVPFFGGSLKFTQFSTYWLFYGFWFLLGDIDRLLEDYSWKNEKFWKISFGLLLGCCCCWIGGFD